jgi:Putative methyltransferase.
MEQVQDTVVINGKSYKSSEIIKYDIEEMKEKNLYDDYRNANFKNIYFEYEEFPNKPIVIAQNFTLQKGGIFWDGSYLLSKYFLSIEPPAKDCKPEKPLRILELGGATSLPSIVAGYAGHNVVTTDLEYLIPFMEKNVYENIPKGQNVEVKKLKWGEEEHMKAISGPFDYIFGAELIYLESTFEDLVKTLKYYSDEKTKIILIYKFRMQEKLDLFFSFFDKEFTYEFIDQSVIKKFLPNPNFHMLVARRKPLDA